MLHYYDYCFVITLAIFVVSILFAYDQDSSSIMMTTFPFLISSFRCSGCLNLCVTMLITISYHLCTDYS